ncbi:MAG: FHA domain-containing protein [Dehalococcoidia bacterium]|nr:FHA domain-containing protein [Dehalococcoidia bacterium]MDD5493698.1 FHA domain-containing protein [Dehalococcoidia bacterium]
MRGLLLIVPAVFLALLALTGANTAGAGAMGAPTENYTIPDIPTSDPAHEEVRPPVNFILQGPSAQAKDAAPGFTANFLNASSQDKYTVTGNENWYLDIDINTPGWLYIYEYYPGNSGFQGKWLAYKWQLAQSGLWKLGLFSPAEDEAEGQHVYRIWFYSGGQWSAENPAEPQDNLVYWTYIKDNPVVNTPPPMPAPVKEETGGDRPDSFMLNPVVLVTGPSLIAVLALLGIYLYRAYGRKKQKPAVLLLSPGVETGQSPDTRTPAAIMRARLAIPGGIDIAIADSRAIGRGDLARTIDIDELGLVSKRHFEVIYSGERFYIEDAGSTNGTRLNGAEIKGKGQVGLEDGDIIEPAGVVQIKFFQL